MKKGFGKRCLPTWQCQVKASGPDWKSNIEISGFNLKQPSESRSDLLRASLRKRTGGETDHNSVCFQRHFLRDNFIYEHFNGHNDSNRFVWANVIERENANFFETKNSLPFRSRWEPLGARVFAESQKDTD